MGAPKASRWLISCCPIFGLGNNTWMTRHYMIVLFQLNIWPLMRFLHSSEFANLLTPEGHFAFLQVNQPVNKETETHKEQSQRNPDAIPTQSSPRLKSRQPRREVEVAWGGRLAVRCINKPMPPTHLEGSLRLLTGRQPCDEQHACPELRCGHKQGQPRTQDRCPQTSCLSSRLPHTGLRLRCLRC